MAIRTRAEWRDTPGGPQLTLVRRLGQPVEAVWAAITTPERLCAWMGVEWLGGPGPLKAGDRFDYRFANTDLESRGRVTVCEPPHIFEHSWFENLPPATTVRWALGPDGEGCRLTLTHWTGPMEDGPRTAAGWTQHIESLAAHLGERAARLAGSMAAWRAMRDRYAAAFPAEADRDGRRVEMDGAPALRFERLLAHSPDAVWRALVTPEALARWMHADETVVDPWPGGRFHMRLGGGSSRMEGVVRRWEPPAVLEYSWPETAARGDSVVRFQIFPHPTGSRLVLTHILLAGAEPADMADFASGWHWRLDALETALPGAAVGFDRPRWQALRQVYVATL